MKDAPRSSNTRGPDVHGRGLANAGLQ